MIFGVLVVLCGMAAVFGLSLCVVAGRADGENK